MFGERTNDCNMKLYEAVKWPESIKLLLFLSFSFFFAARDMILWGNIRSPRVLSFRAAIIESIIQSSNSTVYKFTIFIRTSIWKITSLCAFSLIYISFYLSK